MINLMYDKIILHEPRRRRRQVSAAWGLAFNGLVSPYIARFLSKKAGRQAAQASPVLGRWI